MCVPLLAGGSIQSEVWWLAPIAEILVVNCAWVYNYKLRKFYRMTKAMEMKSNEAYGPVSLSQPPPPPASEGVYDFCQ